MQLTEPEMTEKVGSCINKDQVIASTNGFFQRFWEKVSKYPQNNSMEKQLGTVKSIDKWQHVWEHCVYEHMQTGHIILVF